MHNSNVFKVLFVSLLICPMFNQAMENDLDLLSIYVSYYSSYIPAWFSGQGPQESELMANVRNSKENLKNQFEVDTFSEIIVSRLTFIVNGPLSTIIMDPSKYSNTPRLCFGLHYYFIRWTLKDLIIHNLNNNIQIIPLFQNARVNDYSCIGAVLVAKNASDEEKCNFIQELINDYDFQPTAKDIELAKLALYDAIPAQEKEKIVLLLCNHQEDKFFQLPDIRKEIAQRMIQLCKKEFWLLPKTY